jgi:hypothetical protein
MRLLEAGRLAPEFQRLLQTATEVDIAVAWARTSHALNLVMAAAQRGTRVRAIIGLSGNHTQPVALRAIDEIGELRIPDGKAAQTAQGGIFHPKIFIFRFSERPAVGWIGSANLTDGGFIKNVEAVWEVAPAKPLEAWFADLWGRLPRDPEATIEAYEDTWEPPTPVKQATPGERPQDNRPALTDGRPASWPAYVEALSTANAYWTHWSKRQDVRFSVLADDFSWADTIHTVGTIARRSTWTGLTDQERLMLLGIRDDTGAWGLLGSMRGAGRAKQIFRAQTADDRKFLAAARAALEPLLAAQGTDAAIAAAVVCLQRMTVTKGISHGVATRIMACARPDIAVSVNGGSAPALGPLAGLPDNAAALGRPATYEKLLQWVASQPWYNVPQPADPWQAMLWDMRAALIDCFVYEPV